MEEVEACEDGVVGMEVTIEGTGGGIIRRGGEAASGELRMGGAGLLTMPGNLIEDRAGVAESADWDGEGAASVSSGGSGAKGMAAAAAG